MGAASELMFILIDTQVRVLTDGEKLAELMSMRFNLVGRIFDILAYLYNKY